MYGLAGAGMELPNPSLLRRVASLPSRVHCPVLMWGSLPGKLRVVTEIADTCQPLYHFSIGSQIGTDEVASRSVALRVLSAMSGSDVANATLRRDSVASDTTASWLRLFGGSGSGDAPLPYEVEESWAAEQWGVFRASMSKFRWRLLCRSAP
eukprot:864202-Rhodomonas_salina.1